MGKPSTIPVVRLRTEPLRTIRIAFVRLSDRQRATVWAIVESMGAARIRWEPEHEDVLVCTIKAGYNLTSVRKKLRRAFQSPTGNPKRNRRRVRLQRSGTAPRIPRRKRRTLVKV